MGKKHTVHHIQCTCTNSSAHRRAKANTVCQEYQQWHAGTNVQTEHHNTNTNSTKGQLIHQIAWTPPSRQASLCSATEALPPNGGDVFALHPTWRWSQKSNAYTRNMQQQKQLGVLKLAFGLQAGRLAAWCWNSPHTCTWACLDRPGPGPG